MWHYWWIAFCHTPENAPKKIFSAHSNVIAEYLDCRPKLPNFAPGNLTSIPDTAWSEQFKPFFITHKRQKENEETFNRYACGRFYYRMYKKG